MGKIIHSMSASLDGFIAGPDGSFDWGAPDEELHQFHNDRVREQGAHVLGRRLYETMLYWETAEDDPEANAITRDFASVWKALPKVVFTNTLDHVEGNTRIARGTIAEEIAALRETTDKDIGVGGATLAGACIEQGLVDEIQLFVHPVIVGGGTPFFPRGLPRIDLELIETRTFSSRVVFMRHRRA